MTAPLPMTTPAAHAVSAFPARALRVQTGANAGDPLPAPADSVCGDYYRLDENAAPLTLMLDLDAPDGAGRLAPGSDLGHAGDPVRLEGRLSLMAPDGDLVEVLVLDLGTTRVALPLSPLLARHVYTLIAADLSPGPIRLAAVVAGAFARGTRVALADGRQCAVEDLVPGDAVITRDHGAQRLIWAGSTPVGGTALAALPAFRPVRIAAGALGAGRPERALCVSRQHWLLLGGWEIELHFGTPEALVPAQALLGRPGVTLADPPGAWSFHHLMTPAHEVLLAEGQPAESFLPGDEAILSMPEPVWQSLRRVLEQAPARHARPALPTLRVWEAGFAA